MLLPSVRDAREKFQEELRVWYSCSTYSLKEFGALGGKTKKKSFPVRINGETLASLVTSHHGK